VRFDPEDYAFVAHYDPTRLANQAKGLGKQGLIRVVTLAVSIVIVVIIAKNANTLHPTVWNSATRWTAIFVLAALALIVVGQAIESLVSRPTRAPLHVVIVAVVIIAAFSLLYPVYLLISMVDDYLHVLNNFMVILGGLKVQPAIDALQPLLRGITDARVVLIVILIVGGVLLVASVVLLIVWLATRRSLGWLHRRVINAAMLYPPVALIVCSAAIVYVSQYLLPQLSNKMGLDNLPATVKLPGLGFFDDWLTWLLMAGLMVTAIMLIVGVTKVAEARILLARIPFGNALRVDALGVVYDDLAGALRLEWAAGPVIAGRQRGALPGPELVIGRSGKPAWSVPFMYLDVMPGTIDSAVRAATMNARTLDLSPLDKVL